MCDNCIPIYVSNAFAGQSRYVTHGAAALAGWSCAASLCQMGNTIFNDVIFKTWKNSNLLHESFRKFDFCSIVSALLLFPSAH